LGRGDARGALRLAAVTLAGSLAFWATTVHHTATFDEFDQFNWAISSALFTAACFWVLYLALEPHIRRRWPQSLISWTRLLSGAVRDPLVGSHLLVGCAMGIGFSLLVVGDRLLMKAPDGSAPLDGMARAGQIVNLGINDVGFAMGAFFFFFLLRVLLRNVWIAGAAFILLFALSGIGREDPVMQSVFTAVIATAMILILTRFGLLPMIVSLAVGDILLSFPKTTDVSAWYFGSTLFGVVTVLALTAYAFHTALAGRRVFQEATFDR
jgi:serine/threonine-protein kinase